jgi:rRNA biogenesis protein RRP5
MSCAMKSVEDHGYILDIGISEVSGFLSFKDAEKSSSTAGRRRQVGHLIDVCVSKLSSNGRTCNVVCADESIRDGLVRILCLNMFVFYADSLQLTEVSNVTSILPGELVQGLITAVQPSGLNLQILGFFNGTIDEFHLRPGPIEDNYKVGHKVKARILYDVDPLTSTAPRFALSLADHIVSLNSKRVNGAEDGDQSTIQEAFPIGKIIEAVKVVRVEPERGLIVEVNPGLEGFVHVSEQ